MATRLDVQLDKSGVDQGLKQTADQVKNVGKAAETASIDTKKLSEELKKTSSEAAKIASRHTAAWIEGTRAIDDFITVASSGQGVWMGIRAAANNLSTMATAINPVAGIITAIGLNVGSVVIPKVDEWLGLSESIKNTLGDMIPAIHEYRMQVERQVEQEEQLKRIQEQRLFNERQFSKIAAEYEKSTVERFRHLKSEQEVARMISSIRATMNGLAEEGNLSARLQREYESAISDLLERRVELRKEEKAAQDQINAAAEIRSSVEDRERRESFQASLAKIESEEELDAMIDERVRKAEAFAKQGRLDDNFEKRLAEEINDIIARRARLVTEVADQKRKASDEERREADRLHKEELARIEEQKRERQRADREAAREREQIRREEERAEQQRQRDREQAAQELLNENEGLAGVLAGEGQSLEDVASAVAQNRGQAAGAAFDERMKSGQYDDKGLSQRDLRRMRQREIRRAEASGFRDTRAGRASEDELMQAQQQNARETVNALAESGQVSQGMIEALAEATRQVQQYEQEQARNQADIEQLKQALGRSGRAAQRRRDQANSFRQ